MTMLVCLVLTAPATAQAPDRLPKSMLGKWATDLAACAEQASEIRITVEPRSVLFYEHGYSIRRVTRLKDGSLKASGFAEDDSGRVRGSVTLKLVAADKLQINGGETYWRCRN